MKFVLGNEKFVPEMFTISSVLYISGNFLTRSGRML